MTSNLAPGVRQEHLDDDYNPHHKEYTGGAYRKAKEKLTGSAHGSIKHVPTYKSTRRKIEKNMKKEMARKMK